MISFFDEFLFLLGGVAISIGFQMFVASFIYLLCLIVLQSMEFLGDYFLEC